VGSALTSGDTVTTGNATGSGLTNDDTTVETENAAGSEQTTAAPNVGARIISTVVTQLADGKEGTNDATTTGGTGIGVRIGPP